MRILVDIDGVICAYDFPKIVKEYFKVDLPVDSIFAYDLADVLGVSPLDINKMFTNQIFGDPTFIEGALETLREWESKNYKIMIFSNRIKYMNKYNLAMWMLKYNIPFYSIDEHGEDDYNFQIDDSPAKLMAVNSEVKLLFSQPWNARCLNITKSLIRVKSWEEIREEVDG